MTSARLDAPATTKNSKPHRIIGAEIFAIVLIAGYYILRIGIGMGWIPAKNPGHLFGSPLVVLLAIVLVIIWADLSDRIIP